MNLQKVKDLAKRHILKTHLKIDDNLLHAEKLFIANSAINWVFKNTQDVKVIQKYMIDLEKYLRNEIDLKWIDCIVTKKESREYNDNKEKAGEKDFAFTSGSK